MKRSITIIKINEIDVVRKEYPYNVIDLFWICELDNMQEWFNEDRQKGLEYIFDNYMTELQKKGFSFVVQG